MPDIAYTADGVPYDPNVGYNPLYPQTKKDDTPQYALPVEAPNFEQPSIEQKMQAIQIRIPQKKEPTLTPVDHNPFEFEQTPAPQGTNIIDKLVGTNGVERYQTWPEKMVREGLDAPHKALTTGFVPGSNEEIAGAQAIAGMAGMGSIPMAEKGAIGALGGKVIQSEVKAPPFYSALENAVSGVNAKKLQPQQWLGTLQNAKGIKPEELEATGLKEFLAGRNEPVTKQEVQDFLVNNKIELGEVHKGAVPVVTKPNPEEPHILEVYHPDDPEGEVNGMWGEIIKNDKGFTVNVPEIPKKTFASQNEAENYIAANSNLGSNTKYEKYQLPGGQNYREMLLTLPRDKQAARLSEVQNRLEELTKNDLALTHPKYAQEYLDLQKERNDLINNNPEYKSSHWDEPNVLAHVRMNDRMMNEPGYSVQNMQSGNKSPVFATREEAETYQARLPKILKTQIIEDALPKKSLHLEEIQSDWHQQGRDKGYKGGELTPEEKELQELNGRSWRDGLVGDDKTRQKELDEKVGASLKAKLTGVPNAPFKKSWHELVLKRMLREAAEKGYDRLSWTPGEAQAARYDLSNEVKSIHWQPSIADKNSTLVQIHPHNSDVLKLQVNKDGKVEASFPSSRGGQFEGKSLADVVGKEHADKILSDKKGSLEGEGLKIGGEGMKGFYDQIIPKALEKLGKEHGVKVKQGEVITHKGYPSQFQLIAKGGEHIKDFDTRQQAMAYAQEHGIYNSSRIRETKAIADHKAPIHYIDIPQSLKDTALSKGFPLFSTGLVFTPVDHDPFQDQEVLNGNAT